MGATSEKFGIVILAAGESKRLGKPKQLLQFEQTSLLERIAKTAVQTEFQTVVVLGSNSETIKNSIENLPVQIVVNENWKTGMSSSIVEGLEKSLELNSELSGVILLLCDQPFITKDTILRLVKIQKKTDKLIVASKYADTIGVPTLFMREIFAELMKLENDTGAKPIIKKHLENLAKSDAPEAAFDIDTLEDFEKLQKRE